MASAVYVLKNQMRSRDNPSVDQKTPVTSDTIPLILRHKIVGEVSLCLSPLF